ncbi:cytochrome c1 [Bordetella avium]|uniref:Cytochrome C n=1 Tax=Bordetella avium (strain 197N) TaxID=360910 RepID=Q2KTR9_BORA1|nr:cytochrome c1 [Bordetella avium]AZY50650.1 cytochrome c1 [Bordetella avium]AZY54048.1 cytochrome c1 [Bordetella avium]RIQ15181.1 cytochrome c1 [Bordetella avium]RIQ20015.1 cytochrome c1 [Bordetella avium]RIQ34595.1 cytochrome c1 [Bordetella avium]
MIRKLMAMALLLWCATANALDRAPDQTNDLASLQNGAKLFINYCLNCHSASAMRYNKLQEIGLTEQQIRDNLLFTGEKLGDAMTIAMTPEEAKKWFGVTPPDLSLMARAKSTTGGPSGADYLYTYLRTFYRDTSRPSGWNNLVFPGTAMPHALWQRQGPRELTLVKQREVTASDGSKRWEKVTTLYDAQGYSTSKAEPLAHFSGQEGPPEAKFRVLEPSREAAYDRDIADLTAFMTWMAEPVQRSRIRLGWGVLIFLGLFLVVSWRLNAAYWKHVR